MYNKNVNNAIIEFVEAQKIVSTIITKLKIFITNYIL